MTKYIDLLAVALFFVGLAGFVAPLPKAAGSETLNGDGQAVVWQHTERGWAADKQTAVELALEKAERQVFAYLRSRDPSFEWRPSTEYLKNHLLVGAPQRLEEVEKEVALDKEGNARLQCWAVDICITERDLQKLRDENRRVVESRLQSQRLVLGFKILLLLLVGCALTLGYLRLEERTKGFLPRPLLWGITGLLIVAGIAWVFYR